MAETTCRAHNKNQNMLFIFLDVSVAQITILQFNVFACCNAFQ